jgi:hypothetical protein
MKARNQFGLVEGDLVMVDLDSVRCGGPRTGMWNEHRARKPAEGETATHKVTATSKDFDMVTDQHFSYVTVVPLPVRTVDQIRAEIAAAEGELATLAGEGLTTWTGHDGKLCDIPGGPGFLFTVNWAISDQSYQLWFKDLSQARARLLQLARAEGCVPSDSGMSVDLTAPGCHSSRAYIEVVNEDLSREAVLRDIGRDMEGISERLRNLGFAFVGGAVWHRPAATGNADYDNALRGLERLVNFREEGWREMFLPLLEAVEAEI